jgi:hypothetical protein
MNTLKLDGNEIMRNRDVAETAFNMTPQRTGGEVCPKMDNA